MDSSPLPADLFGLVLHPALGKELLVMGKYTLVATVLQLMAMMAAPKDDRLVTGNLLLWLPLTPVICCLAAKEAVTNYVNSTLETRVSNVTPYGITSLRGYIALQLVGTGVELIRMARMERKTWISQFPIIAHHIISLLGCFLTLHLTQRALASAVTLQLVEVTTIFLNVLLFTKNKAYRPWVEKNVPWLAPLSGVALWISYIAFRIVLVPYIVIRWVADNMLGHPLMKDVTNFELYYLASVGTLIWTLSLVWFKKIHNGLIKAMNKVFPGGIFQKKKQKKKQED